MAEIFTFSTIEEKTSSRSLSYKKFHKRQNYRKGRYRLVHSWENCKKIRIEVRGPKCSFFFIFIWTFSNEYQKTTFFCSCEFIFNCFAIFSKMRQSISTLPVILSLMQFCVAQPFWVERHLDVDLEVLLVVKSKFLLYKTCR